MINGVHHVSLATAVWHAACEFISEPQTMGNHKVKAVYARDPDNNIVELQEIFPGSRVDKSHVRGL